MNAKQVKYEGVEVKLGGEMFVFPPLSLGSIKRLQPQIEKSSELNGIERFDFFVEVIRSALSRNYPDITSDQILEWVDTRNIYEIFNAVMAVSGLVRSSADQEASKQPDPSTGTTSTGESSPLSLDGLGNT